MMNKCLICKTEFLTKKSHLLKGFGKFCSRKCHHKSMEKGVELKCDVCNKNLHRNPTKLKNSKSGKFFCSKSCQTKWRNKEFSGQKHKFWKGGMYTYRRLMENSPHSIRCLVCNKDDKRILAVHHIDENRENNDLKNLTWLCHNCHFLVHHDSLYKANFLKKLA